MSEVEDVSGPSAGPREHVVGRGQYAVQRAEQQRGVELALDLSVVSDPPPRIVERYPPVRADHRPARVPQVLEDGGRADAKVNRRHAVAGNHVEDTAGVGK